MHWHQASKAQVCVLLIFHRDVQRTVDDPLVFYTPLLLKSESETMVWRHVSFISLFPYYFHMTGCFDTYDAAPCIDKPIIQLVKRKAGLGTKYFLFLDRRIWIFTMRV